VLLWTRGVCLCSCALCDRHSVTDRPQQLDGFADAIAHFQAALSIATQFDWHYELSWIHQSLALLFLHESEFDIAQSHVERAKSYAIDNEYSLGRMMELQADLWNRQQRYEEAKSEALRAIEVYEKFGIASGLEHCRRLLQQIEMNTRSAMRL